MKPSIPMKHFFALTMTISGVILCSLITIFGEIPGEPEIFIPCVAIGVYCSSVFAWSEKRFRTDNKFYLYYGFVLGSLSFFLTFILFYLITSIPESITFDRIWSWFLSVISGAFFMSLFSIFIYGWFAIPLYMIIAWLLQRKYQKITTIPSTKELQRDISELD